MSMIQPTVGRVVWYHPSKHEDLVVAQGQPLAAMITCVWGPHMVNLVVHDANGHPHSRTSVRLMQDDEKAQEGTSYCEWMPYQKGQAAKTEQLESQLGKS